MAEISGSVVSIRISSWSWGILNTLNPGSAERGLILARAVLKKWVYPGFPNAHCSRSLRAKAPVASSPSALVSPKPRTDADGDEGTGAPLIAFEPEVEG